MRGWEEFVQNGDGDNTIEFEQITLAILISPSAASSTSVTDLGIHPGQDPCLDDGQIPKPSILHGGRPSNLEQGPTSSDPWLSPKASDSKTNSEAILPVVASEVV